MADVLVTSRATPQTLTLRQPVALLSYQEARQQIYLPTYKYVLDHYLAEEVEQLRSVVEKQDVVLLDYETNADINDLSKPLSYASLVVRYVTDGLANVDNLVAS